MLYRLKGAACSAPDRVVTAVPAINDLSPHALLTPALPWLLIQGVDDDVVPAAEVMRCVKELPERPRLALLEGTRHFFPGRLNVLKQALLETAAAG